MDSPLRLAVVLLCTCALTLEASTVSQPLELNTTSALRTLPGDLAARSIPVRIHGIVTFFNRNGGDLFVLDSTGGIYASYRGPLELKFGDWVDLTGFSERDFTNDIAGAAVTRIGRSSPFSARSVDMQTLASGESDCGFVSVTGIVRSASVFVENNRTMLQLRLENGGRAVDIRILDFSDLDFESLLDSEIRATGAAAGYFNERKQLAGVYLSIQSAKQLQLLRRPPLDPYSLPLEPLQEILKRRNGLHVGQRTRVAGTVTYVNPGVSLTIQDRAHALMIHSRQANPVKIGNRLDVVGFLAFGNNSPFLDDANFRESGLGQQITPLVLTWPAALDGALDSKLVSIDAELLSSSHDATRYSFALASGTSLFSAVLDGPIVSALGRIDPGSRVRVTGICFVSTDGVSRLIHGYQVFLRSADDIRVLNAPRFWSQRRLLFVVGCLLAVVLLASGWVILLRRRVGDQTDEIRAVLEKDAAHNRESAFLQEGRSRVLEKINRREPLGSVLHSVTLLLDQQRPGVSWCIHLVNANGDLDIVPETCFPPELYDRFAHVAISSPAIYAQAVVQRRGVQTSGRAFAHSLPIACADGEVVGAISAFHENAPLPPSLIERLELAAQLSVLAIDNRRLYDELTYRSQHDTLTGLPNRAFLDEQLTRAIAAATESGGRVAIAYVDLDRFKQVNDIYGHNTGDRYLQSVAARLRHALRDCDTLARVGGDEFIALITGVHDRSHASEIVSRLNESLRKPLRAGEGHELACSASIGLAIFPDDGRTLDQLKHHSDEAMYRAKRTVNATGSATLDSPSHGMLDAGELRGAIDQQRVVVHYQPIFSITGKLTGFEALARIERPGGVLIPPQLFIETAEKSGLILEIGDFVLRESCRQTVAWQSQTGASLMIAVNVSATQLNATAFADRVIDIASEAGLPASLLRLELTESAVVENLSAATEHLNKLRRAGVHIAIDDFGTGYANLAALQNLPFDIIKIDRSFVMSLGRLPSALSLLKAILSIAESLNAKTVAEGIELAGQAEILIKLGCSEMQGFGLAKPMSPGSIRTQLSRWLTPVPDLAARMKQTADLDAAFRPEFASSLA